MPAAGVAQSFYTWQAIALSLWWLAVRLSTGHHLHILATSSVLTRPPWLSSGSLRAMHRHRRAIFAALPVALVLGALLPHRLEARLVVAA